MRRSVKRYTLLSLPLLTLFALLLYKCLTGKTSQEGTHEHTWEPQAFTLWYTQPASTRNTSNRWMEYGLPIGNGWLGAMVMGGVQRDEIQLNEKTFWTGSPQRPGAYQNLGSIVIEELDSLRLKGPANGYRLCLDLETAVVRSEWDDTQGTHLTREYLASFPDSCIAIHLTASVPGSLHHRFVLKGTHDEDVCYEAHGASMQKTLDVVTAVTGFRLTTDSAATIVCSSDGVEVCHASDILLTVACKTNYDAKAQNYVSTSRPLDQLTQEALHKASHKGWTSLKDNHINDYQSLFHRMSFRLVGAASDLPMDELVEAYSRNASPEQCLYLEQLCFAYGRYLAIASSRGLPLPSNLQGIWCYSNQPIWNCDMHANINLEMNYWPCEATNLSETTLPLLDWVCNEAVNRPAWRQQARSSGSDGWLCYTANNIFGYSTPPEKGMSYMGASAWLCQHLWQHYLYTQDKAFLRERALPVMLGCIDFWMTRLVRDAEDGTWVCPREWSPEQGPLDDGTAHTQQCVWNLFDCTLKAIDLVGMTAAGLTESRLTAIRDKFATLDKGIHTEVYDGKYGFSPVQPGSLLIREWKHHPYSAAAEQKHRHLSHLMWLYPFDMLDGDSALLSAARNSLLLRGERNTGWSMAWKMCLWARLQDGEMAHRMLSAALCHARAYIPKPDLTGSGIYYNLLSAHPPFQIDGNLGITAGIAEMLVQSHGQTLRLLPALPEAWKAGGSVHGMRVEGGFEVDFQWQDAKVSQLTLRSLAGSDCHLRLPLLQDAAIIDAETGEILARSKAGNVRLDFSSAVEGEYRLIPNDKDI